MTTSVKVLILKNSDRCQRGNVKFVAAGYFNNYLLPKGIACLYTQSTEIQKKNLQKKFKSDRDSEKKLSDSISSELSNQTFTIKVKTHDEGQLYGSVTSKDVLAAILKTNKKLNLELHHIYLQNKVIKEVGVQSFTIRIHQDMPIHCTLSIISDESIIDKEEKKDESSEKESNPSIKKLSRPVGEKSEEEALELAKSNLAINKSTNKVQDDFTEE